MKKMIANLLFTALLIGFAPLISNPAALLVFDRIELHPEDQTSYDSLNAAEIIFKEFDGVSPNGEWRKQYSHEYFPKCDWDRWYFEATPAFGKMHVDGGYQDCPEAGNNQHVVRYDKTIDQSRAYTIECDFAIAAPFRSSINSFCVNFNVQKGMSRDDKINCWSINLDIHDLNTGKYTIKHMGFADIWNDKHSRYRKGSFTELLPAHTGVGALVEPELNHFKIEVNRRIDGSFSPNWVTVTWSDVSGVREHFEEDYSKFPFQPDASKPVRVGLNTHGTSWVVRNLVVYY
ncbi:hypothetical protein D770_23950 [Flammeovirgaceae bacterium 311]|nr:hypothetical protein D770_23950 [Flammeovirgaceae bacterium 311]